MNLIILLGDILLPLFVIAGIFPADGNTDTVDNSIAGCHLFHGRHERQQIWYKGLHPN